MTNETSALDDWFECFTGELLKNLGCRLEKEPCVGRSRPDYHATSPDNDEFYVEATVAKHRPFSDKPTEADVCDKLNAMCNSSGMYRFNAHVEGNLYQSLSEKALLPIKKWIEGLSTAEIRHRSETFTYPSGTPPKDARNPSTEWTVTLIAKPRSETYRGVNSKLLEGIVGGGAVDSVSPLVRAARKKMRQHRGSLGSLMLTINDFGDFPSDCIDVTLALFGWEQEVEQGLSRISPPSGKRQPSLWGNRENTSISAILLFHELTPRTLAHAEVCLYENPWAKYPIPSLLRQSFPHAIVEERQGIQYLRWYPGPRLSSILGIPAEPRPHAELERNPGHRGRKRPEFLSKSQ